MFLFLCLLENATGAETNTNVFEWSARPQLTADQQKLLQLRPSVANLRQDSPLRASQEAEIAAMEKRLGPLTVRRANPYELMRSTGPGTNVSTIFNPTKECLVLTVSVVGDTEQLGTRRASMGRDTYLPAGSTLIVSNLYWTTPATVKRKE